MLDNVDWSKYYTAVQGRNPRPLLLSALEQFKNEPPFSPRQAIDLGCGDGTETVCLLENGWQVFAIDGESAAIDLLLTKVPKNVQAQLQTKVAKFVRVNLPPADFIHASLTLPFCEPEHFADLWQKIVTSLGENGRFAGHFFGVNDSWAVNNNMTFHTEEAAHALFSSFELEYFHEEDAPGRSASGPKHWHIFTVIAKKRRV